MEFQLPKSKHPTTKHKTTKHKTTAAVDSKHNALNSSYEIENDNKYDNGLHIVLPCFHGIGAIPRIVTMHRQGNKEHDMYIQSDLSGFPGPKIAEYTTRAQH